MNIELSAVGYPRVMGELADALIQCWRSQYESGETRAVAVERDGKFNIEKNIHRKSVCLGSPPCETVTNFKTCFCGMKLVK